MLLGLIFRGRLRLDMVLAWAVLVTSLTVMAHGLTKPVIGVVHPTEPDRAVRCLTGLAPVCVLGFLLCPYLDVTFHRARQATDAGGGRFAFGTGFGVVFGLMIVLTLLYVGDAESVLRWSRNTGSFGVEGLRSWVAVHFCVQSGFTIAAHLRAVPRLRRADGVLWGSALALAVAGAYVVDARQDIDAAQWSMVSGEVIYRLFMAFYGLVFPAYVWLRIVPGRVHVAVFVIAILLATPFFWVGFIQEKMAWLPAGVAIVLVAKVATVSRARQSPLPAGRGY